MISKSDLLPVLDDFKPENAKRYLRDIASTAPVIELSSKNKAGMPLWLDWINQQVSIRQDYLKKHPVSADHHHHHHEQDHSHTMEAHD